VENAAYQSVFRLKRNYYDETENTLVAGVQSATGREWLVDRRGEMFSEDVLTPSIHI
jgi:hypothetical protein